MIHDGINTGILKPNVDAEFSLDSGETLTRKDEVVTYIGRALEPYRGFHIFMRALPALLEARPNAKVVIVGREGVSYGAAPASGKSWKTIFCNEVMPLLTPQQRNRVHFSGHIAYSNLVSLLQLSTVHVYLTYPFVLSWSLLEAMSIGCSIVASDTEPLREVIEHDETGLLFNFFDSAGLADLVTELLESDTMRARLGDAARQFVIENYDLAQVCLPKQIEWLFD